MKRAKARKLQGSTRKTLQGKPQRIGKRSTLEGPKTEKIRKALKPWIKKILKKGDLAKIQSALTAAGGKTKFKKEVSFSQTQTWLAAIRK